MTTMLSWMWSSENESAPDMNSENDQENETKIPADEQERIPDTPFIMPHEAIYFRDEWSEKDIETKMKLVQHFEERVAGLDDDVLIRYVRGYHWHDDPLQSSIRALDVLLNTRATFGFAEMFESEPEFDPALFEAFNSYTCGFDRYGHPAVYIELNSDFFHLLLSDESTDDEVFKVKFYVHYVFQLVARKKREFRERHGIMLYQHITVIDVENLGLTCITNSAYRNLCISLIKEIQKVNAEAVHRIFVVNAPTFFTMIANIFLPILDEKTQKKVGIATAPNVLELMKEEMNEDNIPVKYGGTLVIPDSQFGLEDPNAVMEDGLSLE